MAGQGKQSMNIKQVSGVTMTAPSGGKAPKGKTQNTAQQMQAAGFKKSAKNKF